MIPIWHSACYWVNARNGRIHTSSLKKNGSIDSDTEGDMKKKKIAFPIPHFSRGQHDETWNVYQTSRPPHWQDSPLARQAKHHWIFIFPFIPKSKVSPHFRIVRCGERLSLSQSCHCILHIRYLRCWDWLGEEAPFSLCVKPLCLNVLTATVCF